MDRIIVVPDIHGRTFWRKIKNLPETEEVVFLGDYLDPYAEEGITPEMALDEFEDILRFANDNKSRVTLLLGNHDCHYVGMSNDLCRFNFMECHKIYRLFNTNKELFHLSKRWKNTIFTHAGICRNWIVNNNLSMNPDTLLSWMETQIKFSRDWVDMPDSRMCGDTTPGFPIQDCGEMRGGYGPCGSPIWADIREYYYSQAFPEITQIFSHTRLIDPGKFIHRDNFYMCDSRRVFSWDGENLIQVED